MLSVLRAIQRPVRRHLPDVLQQQQAHLQQGHELLVTGHAAGFDWTEQTVPGAQVGAGASGV